MILIAIAIVIFCISIFHTDVVMILQIIIVIIT